MTATFGERLGLGAQFDATSTITRGAARERLLMLGFFAGVISPLLGVKVALGWALAASSAEAWIAWSISPRLMARRPVFARVQRLLASAFTSACWAAAGALLWRLGDTPARLAGAGLLVIVMLYGARACYRSPAHMLAALGPATLALLLLPLSYIGSLKDFAITEAAALVLTAYVGRSAIGAFDGHCKLERTLGELVAEREAAQAASQAKSDFLATISHEIRNPLNGVLGMAQAIGQDDLPAAQHERLAVLQDSGRAVLSLLNDLLDLSRIEAGKLELDETVFDLAGLTRALQIAFEPMFAAAGVALAVELESSAEGLWRGDAARIRQIVSNLLSNAAKFTAQGRVSCRFRYAAPFLAIEVADTGAGIPAQLLPSLFERYSQTGAEGGLDGGAGLGLAVVRQLAELMHGSVAVDSEVGRGTTFTVQLPLVPAEGAPAVPQDGEAAAASGLRVLAADDHAVNRLVLATLLGKAGLDATVVENAPLLISLWESAEFDVILLDLEMPLLDGQQAARRIRAKEAALGRPRTPIIALTGNVMSRYAVDHEAAGMDAVVAKPIEAKHLLRTIGEVTDPAARGGDLRREA